MKNKSKIRKPEIELSKGKKTALIIILSVLIFAAGGYFGYMKYIEHGYKVMLEGALKAKYTKDFTVRKLSSSEEKGIEALLSVDGSKDQMIRARIDIAGTGLEDNYVAVRLCHLITDEVNEKLGPEDYLYVHTDSRLEYTDAGTKTPSGVTVTEYLAEHPEDAFDVTILVDNSAVDATSLRNTIGSAAFSLTTERGDLKVYAITDDYQDLITAIEKTDSAKTENISKALEDSGGSILSLSFEEINPPEPKKRDEQPKKDAENAQEEASDAKDTDQQ